MVDWTGPVANNGVSMVKPDDNLISRCLAGDSAASQNLYAAHGPRVKVYLLRSGFGSHDADDLTQEVFLRVFRSLKTYDSRRGAFTTWLGTIARNVARRQWQRRQQEQFDPQLADEMFAAGDEQVEMSASREEQDALRDCISRLGEDMRRIVHLRYVEGLTTRGISQKVDMAEATVRLRLSTAASLLTTCLREKGIFE
ncbi:MAG: RNA polymerase sigma factor [Phycisphaerae bacterium]|nr:RNA polymerase sigma factor [Phycisphaerae bacterium]